MDYILRMCLCFAVPIIAYLVVCMIVGAARNRRDKIDLTGYKRRRY